MVKDDRLRDLTDLQRAAVKWAVDAYVRLQDRAPSLFFDEPPISVEEIREAGTRIVLRQLDQYVKLYKEQLDGKFLAGELLESDDKKREL
jgi:hypothetical protein